MIKVFVKHWLLQFLYSTSMCLHKHVLANTNPPLAVLVGVGEWYMYVTHMTHSGGCMTFIQKIGGRDPQKCSLQVRAYVVKRFMCSVTEPKISKSPEILGELSMRKQCVPGSFFSAHAQEPGNEANLLPTWISCWHFLTECSSHHQAESEEV